MNTDEDQDVFEITDFTTASEWERFIARIEEVIHEWKLPQGKQKPPLLKGQMTEGTWEDSEEEIAFADFKFSMTRHVFKLKEEGEDIAEDVPEDIVPQVLSDMASTNNDFPAVAHCLARWYGLRDFVVIAPKLNTEVINNESRIKLLLSSICMAINSTNCPVPIFIQIHQKWQRFYLGLCEGSGIRTNFEMVHLRRTPANCNNLTGLLDIFKSKMTCPVPPDRPGLVTIRFTYILNDWSQSSWPQHPPDVDSVFSEVGETRVCRIPFGACDDPISEIHLCTTWPLLSEDGVIDNNIYSDLDPLHAPIWSMRVRQREMTMCLMEEYLSEFVRLCYGNESAEQLLGWNALDTDDSGNPYIMSALDRLAEPVPLPSMSGLVSRARRRLQSRQEDGPIPSPLLTQILYYLFPDAALDASQTSSKSDEDNSAQPDPVSNVDRDRLHKFQERSKQFKAAPIDSLTSNLALAMCQVSHNLGLKALAHLWQEFVLEMRYRWENNYIVPGLEAGPPNLACCLLHQKLQMLNCCIERKKAREQQHRKISSSSGHDGETSSDDEFYECVEGSDPDNKRPMSLDLSFKDSVQFQPEGRLRPFGDLTLLQTGQTLFIPVTQEPAPMTEDELAEHAEVLTQLGTDSEGAQLRARMQSASLTSDMEAFRAANPGCCLEDFVRWYSPRDWIEEENSSDQRLEVSAKGRLSARMLIPGNMWQEAWDSARPVPARRQRRLFDDTREAEKVLHFLASLKPNDVALHLLPALIQYSVRSLLLEEEPGLNSLPQALEQISTKAAKLMQAPHPEPRKYEELVSKIGSAETLISQVRSLRSKMLQARSELETSGPEFKGKSKDPPASEEVLNSVVYRLLQEPEVIIEGAANGTCGKVIHRMFAELQKTNDPMLENSNVPAQPPYLKFPKPAGREYILRTFVPRPAPYSKPAINRMYCVLTQDEFRLAGAFSQDTTFQL